MLKYRYKYLAVILIANYIKNIVAVSIVFLLFCNVGCKKLIDVDAPTTSINVDNVYQTDATAIAVLTGLYVRMSKDDGGTPYGGASLSASALYTGLSSDELSLYQGTESTALLAYYRNSLKSSLTEVTDFWSYTYPLIYKVNAAISGIDKSTTLTPAIKSQLLGEARFLRAFYYFYLVNLYGDLPLVTGTDYNLSSMESRSSIEEIYEFIVTDLKEAQILLSDKYLDGTLLKPTEERVRPSRNAATALLARVYLYKKDWVNAEIESSKLITNSSLYETVPLNEVFKKNSRETIWAIQPVEVGSLANTGSGALFILPPEGPSAYNPVFLSEDLLEKFDLGDQRFFNWVSSVNVEGILYYFPYKYKIGAVDESTQEYVIVFRIGEQYLIRAEALIQQGKIADGIADLNVLRSRATDLAAPIQEQLSQLSSGLSKDEAINALMHERQIELYTEWGHRWLDLKRTSTVNSVMPSVTLRKGGTWDSRWALYPIPLLDIQRAPNLIQNPGYE